MIEGRHDGSADRREIWISGSCSPQRYLELTIRTYEAAFPRALPMAIDAGCQQRSSEYHSDRLNELCGPGLPYKRSHGRLRLGPHGSGLTKVSKNQKLALLQSNQPTLPTIATKANHQWTRQHEVWSGDSRAAGTKLVAIPQPKWTRCS